MSMYKGLGLMSGSSLDGLDICHVEFTRDNGADTWTYRIIVATTVPYSQDWIKRLRGATELSGIDLIRLQKDYSHYIGEVVSTYIQTGYVTVDFVASHGHTIFHQPENSITFQLGEGEIIGTYLHCPFVCNFRNKDVAIGGQGAPLVPYGEKFLFPTSKVCVNLGGIANIGCLGIKGYDICPCNSVLNHLASCYHPNLAYDEDGRVASKGVILPNLLWQLEILPYNNEQQPKSLGWKRIREEFLPLLCTEKYAIADLLRTFTEYVINQVARTIVSELDQSNEPLSGRTLLITGGGAFNLFLVQGLNKKLQQHDVVIQEADDNIVNFKEALIFAFFGLRCLLELENVSSAVTGSARDTISGSIHLPGRHQEPNAVKLKRFMKSNDAAVVSKDKG